MDQNCTMDEIRGMSYDELGAIEDPSTLMSGLTVSPMIVRYMVRTGQLATRYPGVDLPTLLDAIDSAAAIVEWPYFTGGQTLHLVEHDAEVEKYLDEIQPYVNSEL